MLKGDKQRRTKDDKRPEKLSDADIEKAAGGGSRTSSSQYRTTETDTARVTKVDGFTIKQKVVD